MKRNLITVGTPIRNSSGKVPTVSQSGITARSVEKTCGTKAGCMQDDVGGVDGCKHVDVHVMERVRKMNVKENSRITIVDETSNVKTRNYRKHVSGNIKFSKLRKSLKNEKLLENYFEYNHTSDVDQLTKYKFIDITPTRNILTSEKVPASKSDSIIVSIDSNNETNAWNVNTENVCNKNLELLLSLLQSLTGDSTNNVNNTNP